MVLEKLKKSKYLLLILAGYFLTVHLPYILQGGFIIDDWGVAYLAYKYPSLWENYAAWFPLFSNRPIAPLVLTFFSRIYGTWPIPYILTNLLLWTTAVLITGVVMKKYIHKAFLVFLFFFALLPVIATTVIFSPVMQLTATFSFLTWALSFYLLDKHLNHLNLIQLIFSYLLIFVGLLTYEIILPLLTINFLWPWLIKTKKQKTQEKFGLILVKSFLPLLGVTALTGIFQKFIMPHYMPVSSRLDFDFSWVKITQLFLYWFHAAVNDFAILLYSAVIFPNGRINLFSVVIFLTILIGSIIYLKKEKNPEKNKEFQKYIFLILLLAFFASSILYILSGRTAQIIGYENRGMSVTWLTMSLLLALGSSFFIKKKKFYFFPVLLIFCFITLSHISKNYIKSAELQETILVDCNSKISKEILPEKEMVVILANVPHFTQDNFLNEEVFYYFWDFGYAITLKNKSQLVSGGNTLTLDKIIDQKVRLADNKVYLEEGWSTSIENAWYYEYNQVSEQSKLVKIKDQAQLEKIITEIGSSSNTVSPPSFFWQTRDLVMNDPNYFQNYFNRP